MKPVFAKLAVLVAAQLLMACGPDVVFENAQPTEKAVLPSLPSALHGQYVGPFSDDTLDIFLLEANAVAMQSMTEYRMTRVQLDADPRFRLEPDLRVWDATYNQYSQAKQMGDTLSFLAYKRETIAYPNDSLQLKQVGKYYLLSYREESPAGWRVIVLHPTKNQTVRTFWVSKTTVPLLQSHGTVDSVFVDPAAPDVKYYKAQVTQTGWKALLARIPEADWDTLQRIAQ